MCAWVDRTGKDRTNIKYRIPNIGFLLIRNFSIIIYNYEPEYHHFHRGESFLPFLFKVPYFILLLRCRIYPTPTSTSTSTPPPLHFTYYPPYSYASLTSLSSPPSIPRAPTHSYQHVYVPRHVDTPERPLAFASLVFPRCLPDFFICLLHRFFLSSFLFLHFRTCCF